MNIVDIYSNKSALVSKVSQFGDYGVVLGAPEVLSENVILEWLAFNYRNLVRKTPGGSLLMCQGGGLLPSVDDGLVLAVSAAGTNRLHAACEGIVQEEAGDSRLRQDAETLGHIVYEKRDNFTVVDATGNADQYDFTGVVPKAPEDYVFAGPHVFAGFNVLSDKQLGQEHYTLAVPKTALTDLLTPFHEDTQVDVVCDNIGLLRPNDYVVGMHVAIRDHVVFLNPLIGEKEQLRHGPMIQRDLGYTPIASKINQVGIAYPGNFTSGVIFSKK